MPSPAEPFNSQESSTGDRRVRNRLPFSLLLLLVNPLFGFAQQEQKVTLESLLAAAQQAQAGSDYVAAAKAYKQAVVIRPDVPELWANLGLMEHENANYTGAIESFQHAYKLKPSLYVPNLFLGIDLTHTGKAREAIPFLLTAEKIKDTDSQPHLALGRAYASLQEYSLAAHEFTQVIHLDPKQSTAWFSLGIAYLDEVEADARTMSEKEQDSPYAKALFAESLATQSRYLEAVDLYKSVTAASVQPPCMHAQLGFVYLKQHDTAGAAKAFEAEDKMVPACSLADLGRARLSIDANNNDEGMKLLMQMWRRDPGFVRAHISTFVEGTPAVENANFSTFVMQEHSSGEIPDGLYAVLLSALQGTAHQPEEAADKNPADRTAGTPEAAYASGHYEQCASETSGSLKTKDQTGRRLLAACAFLTGNYELSSRAASGLSSSAEALYWSIRSNEKLAFQALEKYEQLEPNSERSHLLLGDIYIQRERYDDGRVEYQKVLDSSPNDPAALLGLASAYFRIGNIPKAVENAQRALNQRPDDPEINLLMGEVLTAQHDFTNAEPFLKKALHAKPQMLPHAHALLGRVYAEEGRISDAIYELNLGLYSDEDGTIHYQLARLYRQTGDLKDATAAMEQMKAIQQRRREGAVIAFKDSHSSSLDDEP